MAVKVAINGFGRIGRLAFRQMFGAEGFEIVAINDLTSPEMLAHLLKYDSAQKRYDKADTVVAGENSITVDGKTIRIYAEKDAVNLPWGELGVDVVLECTGFYTSKEKASAHITAGAKKVVISAPAGKDLPTIVFGVNEGTLTPEDNIISAASCTTNCLAPMAKALNDYAQFLTQEQRKTLLNEENSELIEYDNFSILSELMLEKSKSLMILYDAKTPDLTNIDGVQYIDLQKNISEKIKDYRNRCLCLILPIMTILLLILSFVYKRPIKAIKVILPSFLSSCFSIAVICIFFKEINMFHILSIFCSYTLDLGNDREERATIVVIGAGPIGFATIDVVHPVVGVEYNLSFG